MSKLSASGMNSRRAGKERIRKLTLAALLTAVVVVLALLGTAIRFGTFNINLALVPIVIGAAMLGDGHRDWSGVAYGAWLGFVNAIVILLSGDANFFFAFNVLGTIVTVIAKGILCGLVSGLVYKLVERFNKYAAVVAAALICPLVNTGVFLIGCRLFFWDNISQLAAESGKSSAMAYVLAFFIGGNFLVELAINVILAPVIARLLGFAEDKDTALTVYGSMLSAVGLGFLIFAMFLLWKAWHVGEADSGVSAPGARYVVMAAFSNLVLIGGAVLLTIGIVRKRLLTRFQKPEKTAVSKA